MIDILEKKPVLQVLICTRTKETGANGQISSSCGAKGSAVLRDELKKWAKDQKLTPDIKITASLCLGHCEKGIAACFQPSNEWFGEIQTQDAEVLKAKILERYRDIKA